MTAELFQGILDTSPKSQQESDALDMLTTRWKDALADPIWYKQLERDLDLLIYAKNLPDPRLRWLKALFYRTIKSELKQNLIPLATQEHGYNFDKEREPVNTIVLHHTEGRPEVDLDDLNTLGFLLQYVQDFKSGTVLGQSVADMPIGSGHFKNDRQVFYAYHYVVNQQGNAIQLLDDEHIGWHAGNWNVNKRSIGIALAGNFDRVAPSESQLMGLAKLINEKYSFVEPQKIIGHFEINAKKSCPGETFTSEWRKTLFDKLKQT